MTHEDRPVVASVHSLREYAHPMEAAMLQARGYEGVTFRSLAPRRVVASSHKVINGEIVTAEALGIDEIDAARKLVRLVTRP